MTLNSRTRFTRIAVGRRTLAALATAALVAACGVAACGDVGPNQAERPESGRLDTATASPTAAEGATRPEAPPSPSYSPAGPRPTETPAAFPVVAARSCDPSVVPGAEFPPLAKPTATPLTLHVPILEYHRIVPLDEAGRSLAGLTMSPQVFESQMDALDRAGWHTITLGTLADDLAAGVAPPPQRFVVTIDDGWFDSFTYAYPILARHGYVATFFVIAGRIGQPFFMGTNEIRELAAAGNEIGDHTVDHGALTAAQPNDLTYEIDAGAATIAALTSHWPKTLAYPRGRVDAVVMAAVAACKSMRMAVAEGNGGPETWADRFRVARIEVSPFRDPASLLAQVERVGR